jgi:hypothetical protein
VIYDVMEVPLLNKGPPVQLSYHVPKAQQAGVDVHGLLHPQALTARALHALAPRHVDYQQLGGPNLALNLKRGQETQALPRFAEVSCASRARSVQSAAGQKTSHFTFTESLQNRRVISHFCALQRHSGPHFLCCPPCPLLEAGRIGPRMRPEKGSLNQLSNNRTRADSRLANERCRAIVRFAWRFVPCLGPAMLGDRPRTSFSLANAI